ncbi:MAG: metallophosphoesterase [Alistipes sp.]|nr:metallophosphoesterase [Alistipes sp.]
MKPAFLSAALLLASTIAVTAEAQNIRFAVIADPHIGCDGADTALRDAVSSINADPDTQFVLFLGDIADRGDAGSYRRASKIISALHKPYYVTTGNHDAKSPERYAAFREVFGRGDFRFDIDGVRIVGLPTGPSEPNRHATLSDDDAAALAEACRDTLPVIVAAHHTPDLIARGERIFAAVDTVRIVLWLAGHIHRNTVQATVPGPSAVNVSTLEGGRYNIIEITDGVLSITTVAPRTAEERCWYETRLYERHK